MSNCSTCDLHDFCVECKKNRVALKDGANSEETGLPLYKRGDFIIDCVGIPRGEDFLPENGFDTKDYTEKEVRHLQAIYDPVIWAKEFLDWEPRESKKGVQFQKMMLRCTSPRKVLRLGRRLGKSEVLVITILHFLFTNSPEAKRWDESQKKWVDGYSTILILAPYLAQVQLLFKRINQLIKKNPMLESAIKRNVATPYHEIETYHGTKVSGFSSGSSGAESARGQRADLIILDEMDYLQSKDLENIVALIMEHGDVHLMCSSTPSGRRDYFFKFCKEVMYFKEFYYPSMVNPSWSEKMEAELRELYKTDVAWQHEILAEFGIEAASVFQHQYIDRAMKDYRYEEMIPNSNCMYSIGVDWNDPDNGTKLCVLRWDASKGMFSVVEKVSIERHGWTQLAAIDALVHLNRKWEPDFIYVDKGHGGCQIEVIHQFGLDAKFRNDSNSSVDQRLAETVGIDFGSSTETFDPIDGTPIKKMMKPYMVENLVRRFEQQQIQFSIYDEELHKQLMGYRVGKISASGRPIYEAGSEGDHALDALMVAALAFQMELSEFVDRKYSAKIGFSGRIGEGRIEGRESVGPNPLAAVDLEPRGEMIPQRPRERTVYASVLSLCTLPGVVMNTTRRVYSTSAFNNDDRSFNGSQRSTRRTMFRRSADRTRRRNI